MIQLFKKLQGTAISLFNSLKAQHYYLEGGQGIEMIQALVNKFHPMDNRAIHTIISSMQSLTLADTEELSVYKDKLENYNLQLSWVGQEMSPFFLVFLAQSQLGKSRYKKDIEALQHLHTASGTSFLSLDDLCAGLEHLDKMRGLPYGGAAPVTLSSTKSTPPGSTIPKPKANVGFVAAATPAAKDAAVDSSDDLEMHKDAWVGAVNLPESHARLLRQMFKCVVCRCNNHTLPYCPILKNWSIKKKPRSEPGKDSDLPPKVKGGANSVLAPTVDPPRPIPTTSLTTPLPTIMEAPDESEADLHSPVEFDLLVPPDNLGVTPISGNNLPYSGFKFPLGSVHSVSSSQATADCHLHDTTTDFNLIVDSECTKHMFPYHRLFTTFKETPSSFVTLADKSQVPCTGIGTVQFSLLGKGITLHDVLCVPTLRSPLLSVRVFCRLPGCSFIADNSGSFLTFPTFILPVDDTSDCTILGSSTMPTVIDFDSRHVSSTSAVSDNTRHRLQRRPVLPKASSKPTKPPSSPDSPPGPLPPSLPPSPGDASAVTPPSPISPVPLDAIPDLNMDPSLLSSTALSPSQISAITTAVVDHLKKHGRVTLDLINLICDGYSHPKKLYVNYTQ
jgi:hypothetical protein